MQHDLVIDGGFADPVMAGQRAFKAVMDALARPGTIQRLPGEAQPPTPLPQGLAEIALTLCDHDSPVWLDAELVSEKAVSDWLRFHTGATLMNEPGEADFAFVVGALPPLETFALGSDEYPDQSTTIVLALPSLTTGPALALRGPGVKESAIISPAGLGGDFLTQWAENREQFPRGIDLLLVGPEGLIGLPRTTRISLGGQ